MTDRAPPTHPKTTVEKRREQLELFFWAAFQTMKLIMAVIIVIYAAVALAEGALPNLLLRSL